MSSRAGSRKNQYQCSIEVNQGGKYCVRIRAQFPNWGLSAYFLANSFPRAMKKIEASLQFFQKEEERLRFWGFERSDDPKLAGELLSEAGLRLDTRKEFPRRTSQAEIAPARAVPAFLLAQMRRELSEVVASSRLVAASD